MADWDVVSREPASTGITISTGSQPGEIPSKGQGNRQRVVDFWVSKGAPSHVAEGIADRVNVESGFNPTISGDGGTSVGAYQHHADRMERLKQQKNWQDLDVQNQFSYGEVTGGDSIASAHWDEIKKAPDRKTAEQLWTKYFERPKAGGDDWNVVGKGKYSVSQGAISHELERTNTDVVWADPRAIMAQLPDIENDDRNRSGRQSLLKNLAAGQQIEDIPSLEVKMEDGKAKIFDYDGRKRLQLAIDEGVDRVAIAVHGVPRGDLKPGPNGTELAGRPTALVGMKGQELPYGSFKPVAPVQEAGKAISGAAQPGQPASVQDRVAARQQPQQPGFFDALGGALAAGASQPASPQERVGPRRPEEQPGFVGEVGGAIKDIASSVGGLATMAAQGLNNAIGIGAINAPPESRPAIAPGVQRVGDIATFATGGLTQGPAAEINALRNLSGMPITPLSAAPSPSVAAGANLDTAISSNNFLRNLSSQTALENRAREAINRRFAQDAAAGGPSPSGAAMDLGAARAAGQPMTLADVAGENVRGLLGNVAREPGPARNRVKDWAISRLADVDRDSPISTRIGQAIDQFLATGSARTEAKALAEQRAQGKPLWDEAMKGGGIAPLERQFENEFNKAGQIASDARRDVGRLQQELTGIAGRQSQAGNVYSASASNRARQFIEDKIAEKEQLAEAAERSKQTSLQRLQKAQEDRTANAPGAVWSPYLQRLLDNPKVKEGVRRGWAIERDIADGENIRFNPREYAVVGEDAGGEPIVGAVPNMKLLAVAKEGLDAMLESPAMRDELTGRLTKAGRAVLKLQQGLLGELDRLNPAYKPARDKWAGDTALIRAIRDGKTFHRQSPEEIGEFFSGASESEKQFYRLGAADTMREDLDKIRFAGDPTKAIINTIGMRNRLMPMFRSQQDADRFINNIKRERQMFSTPGEILRGSPTAAREAEDRARRMGLDDVANALHGIASAASGHPAGSLHAIARGAKNFMSPPDQALNDAIARLLLDPKLNVEGAGENFLRRFPLPKVQNSLRLGVLRAMQNFSPPASY